MVTASFWVQDHYDVKMPCHLLLGKLAAAAPDQVRQALPRLVDPLQRTLHAKVKQDAVKQEVCAGLPWRCQGFACIDAGQGGLDKVSCEAWTCPSMPT